MREYECSVTVLTPAMGQILVGGASAQMTALRNAFFVGDVLTKKDCGKLRDLAVNTTVINLWGSTETQRAVSYFEIPSNAKDPKFFDKLPDIMPVGKGMLNVQLLIVDRENRDRLCDVGEQGELFLRAAGMAEGYLGSDEKTAELNRSKFLANWFTDTAKWTREYEAVAGREQKPWMKRYLGPRDRIYRSGDLGRMREDGNVECTGRIDSQVKIRGFRVELGEIDVHLSQHPYVRENVTIVRRDKNEEHTLVTYFVPETKRWLQHLQEQGDTDIHNGELDEGMGEMLKRFKSLSEDCRKYLATKLPKYAVPNILIPMVRMPLSMFIPHAPAIANKVDPNGKVDKPKLPFPDETDLAVLTSRHTADTHNMTETQTRLAKIWSAIIPGGSARSFAPDSNFFDEGGHSILAQQMFFHMKQEWRDIELPVSVIFRSQTLAALAAEIDRAQDPIGLRLDATALPGDGHALDEAYAADAKDLASELPQAFPSTPLEFATGSKPTVLLTGATGFLGSYILHELLNGPLEATVIAHVRAKDAAAGLARLESTAKAYNLWSQEWVRASRLQAVVGDISKPHLGLADETWARLATQIDAVVHNGAQVNWMLPYSSLRAANVLSTVSCIALCATGKSKRLGFVSSTSTLDSTHFINSAAPVSESDDLSGSSKGLATGYGQSKWASEFLVREAGRRGLVGSVIRPGYITGDPMFGISVTDDFLVRLWKGCLQVGARPDIPNSVNVVPVTQVSRIVVAATFHLAKSETSMPVAQVNARPRPTLNSWIGALETYGYTLPQVPYPAWRDMVKSHVATSPPGSEEFALLPLFHFVVGDLSGGTVAPELEDGNAAAAMARYMGGGDVLGGNCVGVDTIGVYVGYLVALGFLPGPGGRGEREVPVVGRVGAGVGTLGGRGGRG